MGKVASCLAVAVLLLAADLAGCRSVPVRAQSVTAPCSDQPLATPMQGHYTGPWQSSGDYHFAVHFPAFNGYPASDRDLEMKIIIDGSLDVTVDAGGHVSGTATGKVDAPIYHDGQKDISSGVGTISGQVSGVFSGSSSLFVLSHPTIDMHWGTFGGHAVETFPVMPDYQLPVAAFDCVSAHGTSTEQGFPVMNITNDATGQLTQAPGVGTASGTWQLNSDQASAFSALSQQVDSFIGQAQSLLGNSSAALTSTEVEQNIVQPLQTLEATIQQNPDLSRCLLARLRAWEASEVQSLFQRAASLAGATDLPSLRQASDALRSARLLDRDCALPESGAASAVSHGQQSALDGAIATGNWPVAALFAREIVLLQGESGRSGLQQEVNADLHTLLQSTGSGPSRLDVARVAYALADDTDAVVATSTPFELRPLATALPWHLVNPHKKHAKPKSTSKTKGKKRSKPTTKPAGSSQPTPTATATPTATPTATAVPKTLTQVLSAGVTEIKTQTSGTQPVFSWNPVAGAALYLVAVTAPRTPSIVWTWSGSATSVTYGDTSIEGTAGTADDGWPVHLPASYTWSVLALDGSGRIVGVRFRAK